MREESARKSSFSSSLVRRLDDRGILVSGWLVFMGVFHFERCRVLFNYEPYERWLLAVDALCTPESLPLWEIPIVLSELFPFWDTAYRERASGGDWMTWVCFWVFSWLAITGAFHFERCQGLLSVKPLTIDSWWSFLSVRWNLSRSRDWI